MCEYFVKADPIQYEQRTRTVRIHGALTSIRLENMVWDVLAEMAEAESRSTNSLIAQFHDEILAHRGELPNFASFLRVTSMRFLRRKLTEAERAAAPADTDDTLRHPNARGDAKPSAQPMAAGRVVPLLMAARS